MKEKLRIAIFGAGSIGCYLGGQLVHSGCHVTFIGRDRIKQALETEGLTLSHYERSDIRNGPDTFTFSLSPGSVSDADIILVTVKSQDTEEAGAALAKHANPNALIISFQNGVRNADTLAQALPDHDILGGVVPFNVTSSGVGRFHCGTEGDLIVQASNDPRLAQLKNAFSDAGQILELVGDIRAVQWGKLLVNLNNALSALSGGTLREGLSQKSYRKVLADMIEEGLEITKRAGIDVATFGKSTPAQTVKILRLPTWLFRIIMARIIKIDKAARSSMLDDLELGRDTEVDYLQGELVRLANNTGQQAPINHAISHAVIRAFETGASPKLSGKEIAALIDTSS